MGDSPRRNNSNEASLWYLVARHPLPLERETFLFVLASALDVFMTYLLLTRGGFYESNPVAAFFLDGWGVKGLVYFKFVMVAFIAGLVQVIAVKRLETARRVLNFATVVVAVVVIYSLTLLLMHTVL